jgi:hypothetical protein
VASDSGCDRNASCRHNGISRNLSTRRNIQLFAEHAGSIARSCLATSAANIDTAYSYARLRKRALDPASAFGFAGGHGQVLKTRIGDAGFREQGREALVPSS